MTKLVWNFNGKEIKNKTAREIERKKEFQCNAMRRPTVTSKRFTHL